MRDLCWKGKPPLKDLDSKELSQTRPLGDNKSQLYYVREVLMITRGLNTLGEILKSYTRGRQKS